jgi:2-keto-4-pentenoate hydratase
MRTALDPAAASYPSADDLSVGYALVDTGGLVEPLPRRLVLPDCSPVASGGRTLYIEAHLAFVLAGQLATPVDAADVLPATAALLPALRVSAEPSATAMVACLLGDAVLGAEDLDDLLVTVKRDGVVVAAGEPGDMPMAPASAVAWLARELVSVGEVLPGGSVVLSGALHRPVEVVAGHHLRADMLGVGSVCIHIGP